MDDDLLEVVLPKRFLYGERTDQVAFRGDHAAGACRDRVRPGRRLPGDHALFQYFECHGTLRRHLLQRIKVNLI